jgi:hypothetical protein
MRMQDETQRCPRCNGTGIDPEQPKHWRPIPARHCEACHGFKIVFVDRNGNTDAPAHDLSGNLIRRMKL